MKDSQALGLRESVYLGALSLGVAFMSTPFVIQVIHTGLTTAAWGDSTNADDPIANMVAMIAITSVVYNLFTKIKNRYGLIACLEGACWMVGLVPIFYWLITKGRALPSIDNYPYLGLFLFIGAICLGILRSRLKKPTAIAVSSDLHSPPPTEDDARLVAEAINDSPPRQQESGGRGGDTKARRWILVAAAGVMVAVAAAIPRSFPLWTSESSDEPVENCQSWYNARVLPIFKNKAPQWVGWANALDTFAKEPERNERLLSDIDAGVAPAELLNRRKVGDKWFAAQDIFDVAVEMTVLDGHWDDDEMKRVAAASVVEMRALMELLALDNLLANTVGFPPFPDSQSFNADLRRATLGLEKACGLETASP